MEIHIISIHLNIKNILNIQIEIKKKRHYKIGKKLRMAVALFIDFKSYGWLSYVTC